MGRLRLGCPQERCLTMLLIQTVGSLWAPFFLSLQHKIQCISTLWMIYTRKSGTSRYCSYNLMTQPLHLAVLRNKAAALGELFPVQGARQLLLKNMHSYRQCKETARQNLPQAEKIWVFKSPPKQRCFKPHSYQITQLQITHQRP